jgi:hypothetical protein
MPQYSCSFEEIIEDPKHKICENWDEE